MTARELLDRVPRRVRAFRLWNSPSLPSAPFNHDHHLLIVPIRGEVLVEIDGQILRVGSGAVLAVPARRPHRQHRTRRRGPLFVVIEWWGGPQPVAGVHQDPQMRIRTAAEWLVDLAAGGESVEDPMIASLIVLIASAVARDPRGQAGQIADALVSGICRELEGKLEAPITLVDVAMLARCTQQQISRRFRKAVGMPPMAWLRSRRLLAARMLLASGRTGPPEVARRCGYIHVRNLYRAMRGAGIPVEPASS
jgi:AraC-like DNA-binding protein